MTGELPPLTDGERERIGRAIRSMHALLHRFDEPAVATLLSVAGAVERAEFARPSVDAAEFVALSDRIARVMAEPGVHASAEPADYLAAHLRSAFERGKSAARIEAMTAAFEAAERKTNAD